MTTSKPADRLVYDNQGKLDNLWQSGVDVHIERMGKHRYWGALYFPDGSRITLDFASASIIEERIRESSLPRVVHFPHRADEPCVPACRPARSSSSKGANA